MNKEKSVHKSYSYFYRQDFTYQLHSMDTSRGFENMHFPRRVASFVLSKLFPLLPFPFLILKHFSLSHRPVRLHTSPSSLSPPLLSLLIFQPPIISHASKQRRRRRCRQSDDVGTSPFPPSFSSVPNSIFPRQKEKSSKR